MIKKFIPVSVRDNHAAAALTGMVINMHDNDTCVTDEQLAVWCYMVADAMMVEREKEYEPEETGRARLEPYLEQAANK